MVRYYGFYANKSKKLLNHMYALLGSKKRCVIKNWKERKKDIQDKLMNSDEPLTEEERIAILGPKDTTTRMKCETCGYEENIPDWVLSEGLEMDKMTNRKKSVKRSGCPECDGIMYEK